MPEESFTTGNAYAFSIVDMWNEIMKLSIHYNQLMCVMAQTGNDDALSTIPPQAQEIVFGYISRMAVLYGFIQYKVTRSCSDNLKSRFKEFSKYHFNPSLLMKEENTEDIKKFEDLLGEAIEELGINKMPSEKNSSDFGVGQ